MKEISLCPMPQKIRKSGRIANLSGFKWIKIQPGFSTSLKNHFISFAGKNSKSFSEGLEVTAATPAKGNILVEALIESGKKDDPQRFAIAITGKGIKISSAGEAGLFYGLQTVSQLVDQFGTQLPDIEIEDWPDFKVRGAMIDISRCKVPSMRTLFDLADLLASLKINHLELYTEHTFAFSAHEIVWRDSSPVTAQEIIELDSYCADRFIELVPNLNSFGHFERWLRHPEYKHFAECPDGFDAHGVKISNGSTLKPDAKSLELIDSLFEEFLPNFRSGSFNVGCDETWELGQGWSKNMCEKKGKTKVYLDHLLEIHKLVRKNKKKMMFWADIILHEPKYVDELPRDIIALNWGYDHDHPFEKETKVFAKYGVPFYVCPGTSSWNTLTGRTDNCIKNLISAAANGKRNGAAGYLNTDWGDGGHHQYLPISYTGLLAGAAYSWSLKGSIDINIPEAVSRFVFKDSSSILGKVLFGLGKVHEKTGALPANSTIFNHLLFWDMSDKKIIEKLNVKDMESCLRSFHELKEMLSPAHSTSSGGQLVKEELLNAIRMAEFGVNKAISGLGGKVEKTQMRKALLKMIGMHEELWLARNRIGGLNESSGRLRNLMGHLER
ncbi:MAG: family 20 glycosylhydrolase [Victivallales bacterium]